MTDTTHQPGTITIGWIGAGRMGAAMASRLALAGEDVTVWNRTRAKAEALTEVGCKVADTIADLRGLDVVFTMVSTPADLEQVLVGEGGLLADPDQVPGAVVDCSTVSTEASAAMRAACTERGVDFLSSPVSGNGKVVRAGGLTLVVSGPEEAYVRFAPLLDHLGKGATYVGEGELARLAKICHNVMLGERVLDRPAGGDELERPGREPLLGRQRLLGEDVHHEVGLEGGLRGPELVDRAGRDRTTVMALTALELGRDLGHVGQPDVRERSRRGVLVGVAQPVESQAGPGAQHQLARLVGAASRASRRRLRERFGRTA